MFILLGSSQIQTMHFNLCITGTTQYTFTCSKSIIETLGKKFEISPNLAIKTPERRH